MVAYADAEMALATGYKIIYRDAVFGDVVGQRHGICYHSFHDGVSEGEYLFHGFSVFVVAKLCLFFRLKNLS